MTGPQSAGPQSTGPQRLQFIAAGGDGAPIACDASPEARAAQIDTLRALLARASAVTEMSGALRVRFRPGDDDGGDVRDVLARWVEIEQACCAFLTYRLANDRPAPGDLTLEISGEPEVLRDWWSALTA